MEKHSGGYRPLILGGVLSKRTSTHCSASGSADFSTDFWASWLMSVVSAICSVIFVNHRWNLYRIHVTKMHPMTDRSVGTMPPPLSWTANHTEYFSSLIATRYGRSYFVPQNTLEFARLEYRAWDRWRLRSHFPSSSFPGQEPYPNISWRVQPSRFAFFVRASKIEQGNLFSRKIHRMKSW